MNRVNFIAGYPADEAHFTELQNNVAHAVGKMHVLLYGSAIGLGLDLSISGSSAFCEAGSAYDNAGNVISNQGRTPVSLVSIPRPSSSMVRWVAVCIKHKSIDREPITEIDGQTVSRYSDDSCEVVIVNTAVNAATKDEAMRPNIPIDHVLLGDILFDNDTDLDKLEIDLSRRKVIQSIQDISNSMEDAISEIKATVDAMGDAVAANTAHGDDSDNPHAVGKVQVGLGSLPNAKSDATSSDRSDILATSKAVKLLHDELNTKTMGYGTTGRHTLLPKSKSIDDINYSSLYNISITSDAGPHPFTIGWYFLHTMAHSHGNGYNTQLAYGMTSGLRVYIRMRDGNANEWSDWKLIASQLSSDLTSDSNNHPATIGTVKRVNDHLENHISEATIEYSKEYGIRRLGHEKILLEGCDTGGVTNDGLVPLENEMMYHPPYIDDVLEGWRIVDPIRRHSRRGYHSFFQEYENEVSKKNALAYCNCIGRNWRDDWTVVHVSEDGVDTRIECRTPAGDKEGFHSAWIHRGNSTSPDTMLFILDGSETLCMTVIDWENKNIYAVNKIQCPKGKELPSYGFFASDTTAFVMCAFESDTPTTTETEFRIRLSKDTYAVAGQYIAYKQWIAVRDKDFPVPYVKKYHPPSRLRYPIKWNRSGRWTIEGWVMINRPSVPTSNTHYIVFGSRRDPEKTFTQPFFQLFVDSPRDILIFHVNIDDTWYAKEIEDDNVGKNTVGQWRHFKIELYSDKVICRCGSKRTLIDFGDDALEFSKLTNELVIGGDDVYPHLNGYISDLSIQNWADDSDDVRGLADKDKYLYDHETTYGANGRWLIRRDNTRFPVKEEQLEVSHIHGIPIDPEMDEIFIDSSPTDGTTSNGNKPILFNSTFVPNEESVEGTLVKNDFMPYKNRGGLFFGWRYWNSAQQNLLAIDKQDCVVEQDSDPQWYRVRATTAGEWSLAGQDMDVDAKGCYYMSIRVRRGNTNYATYVLENEPYTAATIRVDIYWDEHRINLRAGTLVRAIWVSSDIVEIHTLGIPNYSEEGKLRVRYSSGHESTDVVAGEFTYYSRPMIVRGVNWPVPFVTERSIPGEAIWEKKWHESDFWEIEETFTMMKGMDDLGVKGTETDNWCRLFSTVPESDNCPDRLVVNRDHHHSLTLSLRRDNTDTWYNIASNISDGETHTLKIQWWSGTRILVYIDGRQKCDVRASVPRTDKVHRRLIASTYDTDTTLRAEASLWGYIHSLVVRRRLTEPTRENMYIPYYDPRTTYARNGAYKLDHIKGLVSPSKGAGSVEELEAKIDNFEHWPIGAVIMYDGTNWQDNVTMKGFYACIADNADKGCPNMIHRFVMGKGVDSPGYIGGANMRTLAKENLPAHVHGMGHNHPVFNSTDNGGHSHKVSSVNGPSVGHINFAYCATGHSSNSGINHYTRTDAVANHTHNIDVPEYVGETKSAGQGQAFDNRPAFYSMIFIKKCP